VILTLFCESEIIFRPSFFEDLHDPFLMTDYQAAWERIKGSAQREHIMVYGD
jgi:single-stranded DNA-specific DHH superfamily exonuclease